MARPFLRALLFGLLLVSLPLAARAGLLSQSDRDAYRDAFAAARSGDWGGAAQQAERARDPLLRKVLRWMELSRPGNGAGFAEIAQFLEQNPDWPGHMALRQRAEEAFNGASDDTLRTWFKRFPPVTAAGKLRQADLLAAAGQRDASIAAIRDVWVNGDLSPYDEKTFLQRYPGIIRGEDHAKRLDRLLWDGQEDAARRQFAHVSPDRRAVAEARIALASMTPGVERLLGRVPAQLHNDPGLVYERVRWRRRKELYDDAIELLLRAPKELGRPSAWWTERQILARRVLADGKPQLAYRLVARHGMTDGAAFADAEFLAGWIALRFLNDPKSAYDHFVRLHDQVRMPISLARGAYWAGRAAEAQKASQQATKWFRAAAEHATTYYGQLAAARLGSETASRIPPEPRPTAEEAASFEKRELVRVARMLTEIGENERARPFLFRLGDLAKTPGEWELVARLAAASGRQEVAVAVAKRASYVGVPLFEHGYPVVALAKGGVAEPPLVLAMTRQESAFDAGAISRAGARGLMQLMPGTASTVAKSLSLPYSADRLLSDPVYNLTLGRAYLDGLLDTFNGSYVLAIAAYNAGPARVAQWVRDFGDPRTEGRDVIDWIETIPFGETRNYVQRVLENLQIYRVRLGDRTLAFSLARDLRR